MIQIEMSDVICSQCNLPNSLNADGICSQCEPREDVFETNPNGVPWRYVVAIVIVGMVVSFFGMTLPASIAKEKVKTVASRPCE